MAKTEVVQLPTDEVIKE